jgi:ubiquinone biosynthesis monooxygenase Coq7
VLYRSKTTAAVASSDLSTGDASSTSQFSFGKIRNEIMNFWMIAEAASPKGNTSNSLYWRFTLADARREYLKPSSNWHWLDGELSSNLAGETGAVHIYKGALAALSIRPINDDVLEFCQAHMANEASHLQMFQYVVPDGKHTKLLPIWKTAGFALGFFPTLLCGSRALYVTVEAVETFVEEHFQDQIVLMKEQNACPNLTQLLEHCCADEVHHKEDAARRLLQGGSTDLDAFWVQPWTSIVKGGSALAAAIARKV